MEKNKNRDGGFSYTPVPEDILKQACTDCPRRADCTCPFSIPEKRFCPKVKEFLA